MVLFFPLTYHLHHPVSVPKLWAQGEQESLLATWLVIGIFVVEGKRGKEGGLQRHHRGLWDRRDLPREKAH